jgi:hypothetical protein
VSCYDDNPLTSKQQEEENCRLGIGHLCSDKPAGVLTLCPNCKGYVPPERQPDKEAKAG